MSLTCSFRDFANQIKYHLVGAKRRASSTHDCHTNSTSTKDRNSRAMHHHMKVTHRDDMRTLQGSEIVNKPPSIAMQCDCRTQRPVCSSSLTSITVDMNSNHSNNSNNNHIAINSSDHTTQPDRRNREVNQSPHRKPCHMSHRRSRDTCRPNQLTTSTAEVVSPQLVRSESSRADSRMHHGSHMDPQMMTSPTTPTKNICRNNENPCGPTERICNTSMVVLSFSPSQVQYPSQLTHHYNTNSFVASASNLPRNGDFIMSSQFLAPPAEFNTRSTLSLVPDLSVPHGEVHSGSLGATTHTCFHFHQLHQPKSRSRKLINPIWNASEPSQNQSNLSRMTMSYSGLTTVPLSEDTYHKMTASQELSQLHVERNIQRRKMCSDVINCTQSSNSSYSQTIIPSDSNTLTESEQTNRCSQQRQPKCSLETFQIITMPNTSTAGSSRFSKPQPACPEITKIPSDSSEPPPPVLPTRTTSLLPRASNCRAFEMDGSLYENRRLRHAMDKSVKSRPKRSNSSGHDNGGPSIVNSTSCSHVQSINHPFSVHTRSQSDVTIAKLRCYVNTCDVLPNQESAAAADASQSNTPRIEPGLVNRENRSTEAVQASGQPGLLSDEPPYCPRPLVLADRASQASEESLRASPKNQTSTEPLTQTLPVTRLLTGTIQNNAIVPNSLSCGVLDQSIPMNHASRLLGRMSDKLRDGRLADVILLAGQESRDVCSPTSNHENAAVDGTDPPRSQDKSIDEVSPMVKIPAHRVILAAASDYFAAMFGNEVKEASETEIWIRNVEPHALQTLINYIYTGHLDLREDTVEDILEAACFLQIVEASQACERYLIKRLHASNCLGMSRLGDQHGCHLLRRKARKYALEHFTEVAQQPDFLNLSFDELTELLQSDHLHVPNEATVFASCLRWFRNATNHGVNESAGPMAPGVGLGSLLTRLLRFVRLQQLPARLLAEVLDKEPLFHRDVDAIRMLVSALRSHLAPESVSQDWPQLTYAENESLNCNSIHGGSHSVYQQPAPPDPPPVQRNRAAHGVCGEYSTADCTNSAVQRELTMMRQTPRPSTIGRLWALGGKTMVTTRALQEILEYDPYWNTWRFVGRLPGQRQQCGCIVLQDGRLLVVGGRDELKTLSTVECIYTDELMQQGDGAMHSSFKDDRNTAGRGVVQMGRRTRGQQRRGLPGCEESDSTLTRNVSGDAGTELDSPKGATSSAATSSMAVQSNEYSGEAQPGWNVVSAMATHRHGLGVAVLEGVVYAVGGHDGWSYLNTVERWNGKAKSWSSVTPMAVQRSTVGVTALDGLLYAVGGRDGSACLRTVERFNPHTQHWCFIAPMLHRRGGVGVGAVGGRLYAVGGHNAPPNQPHAMRTASVEVYEPRTDMWTEVACLSSPRDSIAVTTLGMKLYALGGHDGHIYTDRVQVYDPETNQWTDVAPLPSGRAGVAVASRSVWPVGSQSCSRFPYYKADPLA